MGKGKGARESARELRAEEELAREDGRDAHMLGPDHHVVAAADLLALFGSDGVLLDDLLDEGLGRARRRVRPPEERPGEGGDEDQHGGGGGGEELSTGQAGEDETEGTAGLVVIVVEGLSS